MIVVWLTLAGCLAAVYDDVKRRRIPNWLTGSLAAAALVVHAFGGLRSLALCGLLIVIMTLLGALLYSLGGIGGGDIKLAVAASAMLGFPLCIPFLLYTAIGGGVLAVIFVALRRGAGALPGLMLATIGRQQSVETDKAQTMPYAIALSFGAAMVALSQSVAPFLRISL